MVVKGKYRHYSSSRPSLPCYSISYDPSTSQILKSMGVRALPTFIVFEDGEVRERFEVTGSRWKEFQDILKNY